MHQNTEQPGWACMHLQYRPCLEWHMRCAWHALGSMGILNPVGPRTGRCCALCPHQQLPPCRRLRALPTWLCSYNIWHTWDEGLMGVFQTLREQGLLPLVQVDKEGNMRWVLAAGSGGVCTCAWGLAGQAGEVGERRSSVYGSEWLSQCRMYLF